ncbi:MAG TPA: transporter substrate-binding domain-containing protein, partial [Steroidobacter sp.]|nr:transporter substrate-binding domain-containing protein [Steroidobacter sp.]
LPIFPGGNRAVVRADAPTALRNVLSEQPTARPVWRGSPAATVLEGAAVAVVSGTTTEKWLAARRSALQINAEFVPVPDYRTGLQRLLDRKADVFFGERTVVLGALGTMESSARENLVILDRRFTHEPIALALPRGDDDFRLLVDRALSQLYASEEFVQLYTKWCGEFDAGTRAFFLWNTPAE